VEISAAFRPSSARMAASCSGLRWPKAADGAGDLADAQVFGGGVKAAQVAAHLGVPEQQLHAEGGGLGVDAVGAADGGRVLEFDGALAQDVAKPHNASRMIQRLRECQRLRGVDDIGGGETVVQPARVGTDALGDRSGKGENVVPRLGFDLVDAFDGEAGTLRRASAAAADGNDAGAGRARGRGELHAQPVLVLALLGPDGGHRRPGVAGDHELSWRMQARGTRGIRLCRRTKVRRECPCLV
jgi:hypothetical protein